MVTKSKKNLHLQVMGLIMIKLENIKKQYQMGEQTYVALKGIDLEISEGESVAIIGPSGSGKTTTMNIIGLLDRPSSGSYLLNGTPAENLSDDELATMRNIHIGFVFQQFFLLPKLSAVENVMLPLQYQHVSRSDAEIRAKDVLERMGLGKHFYHTPNELSGGQKQRVAIARALVTNPSILLADEPTGALDTKTSAQILECLQDLNRNDGATVIIVTHDPKVAASCKRQIDIRDGLIWHDSKNEN